jgi:hypothetical protein
MMAAFSRVRSADVAAHASVGVGATARWSLSMVRQPPRESGTAARCDWASSCVVRQSGRCTTVPAVSRGSGN